MVNTAWCGVVWKERRVSGRVERKSVGASCGMV